MGSLKGVAEYLSVSLFHLKTLKVFQTAQDFHEFKAFQLSLSSEGYFSIFDHATLKKSCLLLFTIPYKAMLHWKGQRLNFQKKNFENRSKI